MCSCAAEELVPAPASGEEQGFRALFSISGLMLLGLSSLAGCRGRPPRPPELFHDVTAESGLDFVHFNGASGDFYFPEVAAAGAGLVDFDGDGDLDVYLLQGQLWPGRTTAEALFPEAAAQDLRDRLFRNDLEVRPDGTRRLRFTDVTAASQLAARGYGMGVAAGDCDNDGRVDLYVTNFGPNQLWHNDGPDARSNVTWSDVTAATGTGEERWSASAAFFDYDRDGWLDLFVANYVDFRLANHKQCRTPSGRPDYCGPASYVGEPDRLFHNSGPGPDGRVTFEDVSVAAGIFAARGSGLGVAIADFDADGWLDVYVANDQMPNFLWHNEGDGTFRNEAALSGSAVNEDGKAEASMGVEAGDLDNDGDEDLFMTHLNGETNTFFANDGRGLFLDRTEASRLGGPSVSLTGFGTAMLDFDNDGWLDILAANGAVNTLDEQARAGDPFPFKMRDQLFRNLGDGRFAETAEAGEAFEIAEVSRGVAVGDLDNDGDPDAIVTHDAGPARVLINQVGQQRRWLGLRLVAGSPARDQLGARVRLERADGETLWRRARTNGSYCSARDPRVLFGLGTVTGTAASASVTAQVDWPGGKVEEWRDLPIDRYTTLTAGTGSAVEAANP